MIMLYNDNDDMLGLSKQQFRVCVLLRGGHTVRDSARIMGITYATAYGYYNEAKSKFGTDTMRETLKIFDARYRFTLDYLIAALESVIGEEIRGKSRWYASLITVILCLHAARVFAQGGTVVPTSLPVTTALPTAFASANELLAVIGIALLAGMVVVVMAKRIVRVIARRRGR